MPHGRPTIILIGKRPTDAGRRNRAPRQFREPHRRRSGKARNRLQAAVIADH